MTATEKYELFRRTADIPRTGWLTRGITAPESIAAHMYGCFLLAYFLLPEALPGEDYTKKTVLEMLLLHDLGEAVTGDIPRPVKATAPARYDREEDEAIRATLLTGETDEAQLWEAWRQQSTADARIAKDIDDLQAIHTFCEYCLREPACFPEDDRQHWLAGLKQLRTPQGRAIAKTLLYTNERFRPLTENL